MKTRPSERYRSWLIGELLLVCVLAIGTILLVLTGRLDGYALPNARIALDTAVAITASMVAVLAATRFLVEGRAMDLLLAAGFFATGVGTFAFAVAPVLSGDEAGLGSVEAWAAVGAACSARRSSPLRHSSRIRTGRRNRALAVTVVLVLISLAGIWSDVRFLGSTSTLRRPARHPLTFDRRGVRPARSALAGRRRRLRAPLSPPRPRSR